MYVHKTRQPTLTMLKILQNDQFDQLEKVLRRRFRRHLAQLDVPVHLRIVVRVVAVDLQVLLEDLGAGQSPDALAAAAILLRQAASVATARTTAILPSSLRRHKADERRSVDRVALQALAAILTHHLLGALLALGGRRWLLHDGIAGGMVAVLHHAIDQMADVGLPIQMADMVEMVDWHVFNIHCCCLLAHTRDASIRLRMCWL